MKVLGSIPNIEKKKKKRKKSDRNNFTSGHTIQSFNLYSLGAQLVCHFLFLAVQIICFITLVFFWKSHPKVYLLASNSVTKKDFAGSWNII